MEYIELLRSRRILTWYTGILLAGLIIEALSFYLGHGKNEGDGTVRLSMLAGGASFGALLIATFVIPGLSAEAAHTTPLIFTRPMPRDAIATRYVLVDVATILIGYALTLAAMLLGIAIIGGMSHVTYDPPDVARNVLLGYGAALMWYAVVSVAAARLPGRGALFAGLSWAVFLMLTGFVHAHFLPQWLHDVVYALNYLNPTAWLGGMTPQGNSSILPYDVVTRTVCEWAIALALIVASIRLWSTREA
jgi:hypothetical protein